MAIATMHSQHLSNCNISVYSYTYEMDWEPRKRLWSGCEWFCDVSSALRVRKLPPRQNCGIFRIGADFTSRLGRHSNTTTSTMSLLKTSISSRLVATASRWTATRPFSSQNRLYTAPQSPESADTTTSADPPAPKAGEAELVEQGGPGKSMARHQPDYGAAVDYRTRYAKCVAAPVCESMN